MSTLTERYADRIVGHIECLDRVIITGTLPGICYAEGMAQYLRGHGIRIFDYPQFAKPLKDRVRENAERVTGEAGVEIEFIRKKTFRKEERVRAILEQRGDHPGLVHVFSAMEPCNAYKPWHDKQSHQTFLKPDSGKCLHYYFYFIDEQLGLCYLRVPTWCPFRLQFYFNGHAWLARQLNHRGIGYEMLDNAFVEIDDWQQAQKLADRFDVKKLHRRLDRYAKAYCPVLATFKECYHWSLMQAEYASDLVFHRPRDLQPLYETITRTAIHAVKADQVATFLGRKLHGNYQGELGNHFHTRIEGTRIKHHMAGKAAIKMYDKGGRILRIETTVNDVSFFKHYRRVEHRDGSTTFKQAPLQKTIYSLPKLVELCRASNRRYLAFISELEDPSAGVRHVKKIAEPVRKSGRTQRGFNLLGREDHELFLALARGEHNISGLTNRSLRQCMPHKSGSQMSRVLKRLRAHGLLKKVGRTYKYYLTKLGRTVVLSALKLRNLIVIPALAQPVTA